MKKFLLVSGVAVFLMGLGVFVLTGGFEGNCMGASAESLHTVPKSIQFKQATELKLQFIPNRCDTNIPMEQYATEVYCSYRIGTVAEFQKSAMLLKDGIFYCTLPPAPLAPDKQNYQYFFEYKLNGASNTQKAVTVPIE